MDYTVFDFFEFFVYFSIGVVIASFIRGFVDGYKNHKEREKVVEFITKRVHTLKVEKHKDTFYWFDAETGQFIAQGQTVQEFQAALRAEHPSKVFLFNNYCFVGPDFDPIATDGMTEEKMEKIL